MCVYFNHEGYGDIVVLFKALEGRQIGFIAKDALENVPYFGKWIKAIRGVFIKRGNTREALKSIQAGVDTLKDGFHWSYFLKGPEVADLEWLSLKPEALNWLQKAKVPIVPITINGSYDL